MMAGGDLEAAIRCAAGADRVAGPVATVADFGPAAGAGAAATAAATTTTKKKARAPSWKVVAILMARSKSGYSMRFRRQFLLLIGATVILATSFRLKAGGDAATELSHLGLSALLAILLPVVIIYYPLTAQVTRNEWTSLNNAEVVDGLYHPLCTAAMLVLDHFAVGVVASFSVVGIMHAILWGNIISELPGSSSLVYV
ncbi:unnamed protein product, partial [Ectocarpus fasciculatus]